MVSLAVILFTLAVTTLANSPNDADLAATGLRFPEVVQSTVSKLKLNLSANAGNAVEDGQASLDL